MSSIRRFLIYSLLIATLSIATLSIAKAEDISPTDLPLGDENPASQRPIQIPELPPDQRSNASIAYILRRRGDENRIKELELFDSTVPVVLIAKGSEIKPTIALHANFNRPGWKIFTQGSQGLQALQGSLLKTNNENIQKNAPSQVRPNQQFNSEFTIYAHLLGRVSEVALTAIGPNGEKQSEKVYIYAPNARAYHVVSAWDDLLLSAGLTTFSYAQTGFGAYESINALASIRYGTPDSDSILSFVASAEMTILAFASSPINTSPQIFEARGDVSIRPGPKPTGRLRSRILIGGTYLTMFSNGSPFGFSDLTAPEIGIQSRYIASFRDDWIGEIRYIPVGGITKVGQQGINLSIAWSKLLQDSRRLETGLTYSAYNYLPDDAIAIQTSLISLRLGLTL